MAGRRRKTRSRNVLGRALSLILLLPALYLPAALLGAIVPANRHWREPAEGTTIYIADNGVHSDLIMPVKAMGLDWGPLISKADFAALPAKAEWIAFGAGEQHVYLNTPRWSDIRAPTIWSALTGGPEVIHAEYVGDPSYAKREVRLRPEEYRRLWASVRAEFALDNRGHPQRIHHPGYGCCDAFYRGHGKASMFRTCNSWVADRLRLAGVRVSLWSPFVSGLLWRYRPVRA